MPTAQVALDTSQYVRVNVGFNGIVLQSLRDAVRVVLSKDKPALSNVSFHKLGGASEPLTFGTLDTNVWALATSSNCSLIVTEIHRHLPVSSQDSFSSAGQFGKAFAATSAITIPAATSYSVRLQKNADIAVRFIQADNIDISAVKGTPTGDIVTLPDFISTNGIIPPDFSGSIEIFDGAASGHKVMGAFSELTKSFYPDGQYSIGLHNPTDDDITVHLTVGVEQISESGVYNIIKRTHKAR